MVIEKPTRDWITMKDQQSQNAHREEEEEEKVKVLQDLRTKLNYEIRDREVSRQINLASSVVSFLVSLDHSAPIFENLTVPIKVPRLFA